MAHRFLTDEWFEEYERLSRGVEIPPKLAEVVANLTVQLESGGVVEARMDGGFIRKGFSTNAIASITAPENIIYTAIVLGDLKSAMPAVFSGKLRIDGSKAALIKLAGVPPTPSQQQFTAELRQMTAVGPA